MAKPVLKCIPNINSIIIYEFVEAHTRQNAWNKGELFCAQNVLYKSNKYIEIMGVFINSNNRKVKTSVIFDSIYELKQKLRLCKKNKYLKIKKIIAGTPSSKLVYS